MPRTNAANLASTTLAAAMGAADTTATVASGASFPPAPFRATIESEIMEVGAASGTAWSSIRRGVESTTAATHASGVAINHFITAGQIQELMWAGARIWAWLSNQASTVVTGSGANGYGGPYGGYTSTGATASSTSSAYMSAPGYPKLNYTRGVSFSGKVRMGGMMDTNIVGGMSTGPAARTNTWTKNHIGIQLSGGNFVASCANGTAQSTSIIAALDLNDHDFSVFLVAREVHFFWDGIPFGKLTTNVPTGYAPNGEQDPMGVYIANGASAINQTINHVGLTVTDI